MKNKNSLSFYPLVLRRTRLIAPVVFVGVLFAVFAPNTFAQDQNTSGASPSVISDRLERIERDIQTLNRQLSRMPAGASTANSGAPTSTTTISESDLPAGALDRILTRISKLEEEVRIATDAMERSNHRFDVIEQRLETVTGDTDFRLSRLENGTGAAPQRLNAAPGPASVNQVGPDGGQAITPITGYNSNPSGKPGVLGTLSKDKIKDFTPASPTAGEEKSPSTENPQAGAGTAVAVTPSEPIKAALKYLPEGSADDQYKHSFNLLRTAKYSEAELAWKEFIEIHPDDKLSENARYWLGETYYVQKRFLDSAQAFLQSYQTSPQGSKAADSLLKLGKSMSSMDKKEEACAAYSKLRKEFSALSPDVSKTLDRETKELGCK